MTIIEDQQAKYLIKSLQHHPSPYLIFCKDDGVEWMNQSAQYVFDTTEIRDIGIAPIISHGTSKKIEAIGSSFQSDLELSLRKIKFSKKKFVNEKIIFQGNIGRIRDIKKNKIGDLYLLSDKGELWRMYK